MDNFIAVSCLTNWAICWLLNSCIINSNCNIILTICASKKCSFHFRVNLRSSYNYSSDAHQPVYITRTKAFYFSNLVQLFNSNHKLLPSLLTITFLCLRVTILNKEPLVQVLENIIKEIDHLSWKIDELKVQFSIIIFQMNSLNLKNGPFHELKLIQLVSIDQFCYGFSLLQSGTLEVKYEPLKGIYHMLH